MSRRYDPETDCKMCGKEIGEPIPIAPQLQPGLGVEKVTIRYCCMICRHAAITAWWEEHYPDTAIKILKSDRLRVLKFPRRAA